MVLDRTKWLKGIYIADAMKFWLQASLSLVVATKKKKKKEGFRFQFGSIILASVC